jgi:hypothetical protein
MKIMMNHVSWPQSPDFQTRSLVVILWPEYFEPAYVLAAKTLFPFFYVEV